MIDDQLTNEHWLTYTAAAEKLGLTVNAVRALARRQGWPRRSPNVIGGQAWVAVPADRLAINADVLGEPRSKPTAANDQASLINGHDPDVINDHNCDERRPGSAAINNHVADDRRSEPSANDQPSLVNDHDRDYRRLEPTAASDRPFVTNDHNGTVINDHVAGDRRSEPLDDQRSNEILTAVREVVERITEPLQEQVADLKNQLATEKLLRADDKERADRAEQRTREAETRAAEFQQQLQTEMIEHRRVVGLLAEQLAARRSWWPWRR